MEDGEYGEDYEFDGDYGGEDELSAYGYGEEDGFGGGDFGEEGGGQGEEVNLDFGGGGEPDFEQEFEPEVQEGQEFGTVFSDRERLMGALKTGSKEELFMKQLTDTLERYNVSTGYTNKVLKIPRYWTKNPTALTIAFKFSESLIKKTNEEFKTNLKKFANQYSLTEADLFRYYRLVQ